MARIVLSVCLLSFVVVSLCIRAVESKGKPQAPACTGRLVRLDTERRNLTHRYVEGRVQVCEDGEWKNLCDVDWTLADAQVTCRTLNYSTQGARNISMDQGSSGTFKGVQCTGTEATFSDCRAISSTSDGICQRALLVQCFELSPETAAATSAAPAEDTPSPENTSEMARKTTTAFPNHTTARPHTHHVTTESSFSGPSNPHATIAKEADTPTAAATNAVTTIAEPRIISKTSIYHIIGILVICGIGVTLFVVVFLAVLVSIYCFRWSRKNLTENKKCYNSKEEEAMDYDVHSSKEEDYALPEYPIKSPHCTIPLYEQPVCCDKATYV